MKVSVGLLLLLFATSCAQTVAFRETPQAPAALGEAKIETDRNNNTRVELDIRHLAPPQNLTPPKSAYIVWFESPEGRAVNMGQLTVGSDRRARFSAVTPFKVLRVLVTAEDRVLAESPGEQVVLRTETFRAGS
jgi:hypothetical protein